MTGPYTITWERGSAGWNEPRCNGQIIMGGWAWVDFAQECNRLCAIIEDQRRDLRSFRESAELRENTLQHLRQTLDDIRPPQVGG